MVVIRNLTEDLKFDTEGYLYWLHDVSEKDISTEGYVGISLNLIKGVKVMRVIFKQEEKVNI